MSDVINELEDPDAEQFVRELFEHVLRLDHVPESEVVAWKQRVMDVKDPVKVFRAIIDLPIHKQQLAIARDARTHWSPGHFYSPAVSRNEAAADRERILAPRDLLGIELRDNKQLELLAQLVPFMKTIPFPEDKTSPYRYHYVNPSYGYGDAIVYWAMLHRFRPRQIIEVGSGYSSALALDTIDILDLPTVCTFVDPYPAVAEAATAPLTHPHRILPKRIQDIDTKEVEALEANDFLFIDSSHVLKAGSDVHFELTELLPRLKPGVLVHFHDTFRNFEYPEDWIIRQNHSWNELYGLHLFLMYNTAFQIEYFNHHIAKQYPSTFEAALPELSSRILLNPGGGLWIRRV